MSKTRVLVGMSGGIDSSAVCMMLQEQGYEVVGATMRMRDLPSHFKNDGDLPGFIAEARELADRLGSEHHVIDIREEFQQIVIKNFIDEYLAGHTPNPCVMCNLFFKWRYLIETADALNCELVATGHYARIENVDGIYKLYKGVDEKKDQSYFLWRLGQKELSRTLFPLGGLKKDFIKEYVLERGFKEKVEKKESMEVCFIENDYRDFLRENIPDIESRVGEGYFVDSMGKKIGRHSGFPFYTIGQRKGLGIALGHPAFVVKINTQKNTIRIGTSEELLQSNLVIDNVNVPDPTLLSDDNLEVRIRYRSVPLKAKVEVLGANSLRIDFSKPASAVTPGQSAVIYKGDLVVGGGIIVDKRGARKIKNEE